MNNPADPMVLREILMEHLAVMNRTIVSTPVLENAIFDVIHDEVAERLVISLKSFVTAHHKGTDKLDVHWETHSTAWEHFKDDYMPGWFKRKWPVKKDSHHQTKVLKTYLSFPESTYYPPALGKPFPMYISEHRNFFKGMEV